jgi:hypothetical protein
MEKIVLAYADDFKQTNEVVYYELEGDRVFLKEKEKALERLYFIYRRKYPMKKHSFYHILPPSVINAKLSDAAKKGHITRKQNKLKVLKKKYDATLFPSLFEDDKKVVQLQNALKRE